MNGIQAQPSTSRPGRAGSLEILRARVRNPHHLTNRFKSRLYQETAYQLRSSVIRLALLRSRSIIVRIKYLTNLPCQKYPSEPWGYKKWEFAMSDSIQPAPASSFTSNPSPNSTPTATLVRCPPPPSLLLSSHLSKSVTLPFRTASSLRLSPALEPPRTTFTPTWEWTITHSVPQSLVHFW